MILVCTRNPERPLRTVEAVTIGHDKTMYVRIDGMPRSFEVAPNTPSFHVEMTLARAVADAEHGRD